MIKYKVRGIFPIDHTVSQLYYRSYGFYMPKNIQDKQLIEHFIKMGIIIKVDDNEDK